MTSEPVVDADEPCPGCGGTSWERVAPSGGRRRERPSATIVCVGCGHEVSEGSWYSYGSSSVPNPFHTFRHWWRMRELRRDHARIENVAFPVYAPDGGDPHPCGNGWSHDQGIYSVSMRQDDVEVTTEVLRQAHGCAADALRSALMNAEPVEFEGLSTAALALRLDGHRRRVAERTKRAEPLSVELHVDDTPLCFTGLQDPAGWAAVAETREVRITVAARGVGPDDVALRRR